MKKKIFIIITVTFCLGLLISCIDWLYHYDTKINRIEVSNGKYENSKYAKYEQQEIESQSYSLIIKCPITDSLTYSEKLAKSLQEINLFHKAYAGFDPYEEFKFEFKDSIKSLIVYSLFQFNDTLSSRTNLIEYFDMDYLRYMTNSDYDYVIAEGILSDQRQINQILSNPDRTFNAFMILLRLKHKPKYEQQRFVVNMSFVSGKQLNDTSNIIRIK